MSNYLPLFLTLFSPAHLVYYDRRVSNLHSTVLTQFNTAVQYYLYVYFKYFITHKQLFYHPTNSGHFNMFHTFRGSPGSSRGKLLRVLLATGSSNSPPTATSPIYHKPTERTKGENTKHWYTQEDPNPGKEHQEHNKQGMMF